MKMRVTCRAILVDSTRRGKRMPDALSKTVPIWCTVINRLAHEEWENITFPSDVVSEQERSSIEALIPTFLTSVKVVLSLAMLTKECRC